jgi:hypothetical protein
VKGRALIVGGGIGGLAAAIALQRSGWETEVFERAPELGEVGAGLSLWRNALTALDRIGLLELLRGLGVEGQTGAFRTPSGETLLAMRAGPNDTASEGIILLLHRAELLDVLNRAARPDAVQLGALCVGWTKMPRRSPPGSRTGVRRGATCWSGPTAFDRSSARPSSVRSRPVTEVIPPGVP